MKRSVVHLIAVCFLFIGCATIDNGKDYRKLSREQTFSFYFPRAYGSISFDDIDSAYDYVNTARAKMNDSIFKSREKGLNAILSGPLLKDNEKVQVFYFITADSRDLSKETDQLENRLNTALSVSNVFLIFYNNKAISISDFYLEQGYMYDNNNQYEYFKLGNKSYKASYPSGWDTKIAFQYLK